MYKLGNICACKSHNECDGEIMDILNLVKQENEEKIRALDVDEATGMG